MVDFIARYDDLECVTDRKPDPNALTLCAIGRNEMFFLPAFLDHYRRLGIEQFAILDDRSDDGTTEFLHKQSDVVVYRSGFKYGDTVELPDLGKKKLSNNRILYIWRTLLFQKFARNRWAIQVDLDEFLQLPDGMRFQDLETVMERTRHSLVYGLMLDVYPKCVDDLSEADAGKGLDLAAPVFFDGEPHLKLRRNRYPKIVHPGARARLYHSFGLSAAYAKARSKTRSRGFAFWKRSALPTEPTFPIYNTLQKPVFAKWPDGAHFLNSHRTTIHGAQSILLPVIHYRFTSMLYQKIEIALSEKSYSSNSLDHQLLLKLLQKMREQQASFLYASSVEFKSYSDLTDSGNAFGL